MVLAGVAGFLLAATFLFGVQQICTRFVTALLRRRYPSLSARRAYLLSGMAYYTPNLTDTQRLEKIRNAGRTFAFMAGGLPILLPTELASKLVWKWLGLAVRPDWNGHYLLLWAGFGISLSWVVLLSPWVIAKGKFAREALQQPLPPSTNPAETPPTFWPSLRPIQPE